MPSRINEINRKMRQGLEVTSWNGAQKIAASARRRAPVLQTPIVTPSFTRMPGWLRDSIEAHPGGEGDDIGATVTVGRYWGLFQERGTENMAANPFLEPAALEHEDEIIAMYGVALKEAVE